MYWLCSDDSCKCGPKPSVDGYTVFMAVLFAGGSIYIVAGVTFNKHRHPEQTLAQSIPNKSFWSALPGLAKDGLVFTFYSSRRKANNMISASRGYDNL